MTKTQITPQYTREDVIYQIKRLAFSAHEMTIGQIALKLAALNHQAEKTQQLS